MALDLRQFYLLVSITYGSCEDRFPPTAATVSSSLLLGICGLPDTIFRVTISHCFSNWGAISRISFPFE